MEFSGTILTLPDTQCLGNGQPKPGNEQKCFPPEHCQARSKVEPYFVPKAKKYGGGSQKSATYAPPPPVTTTQVPSMRPTKSHIINFNPTTADSYASFKSLKTSSETKQELGDKNVTEELTKMRKYVNKIEKSAKLVQVLLNSLLGEQNPVSKPDSTSAAAAAKLLESNVKSMGEESKYIL